MGDKHNVALDISSKELMFLQKVTRQSYHFVTDEEQDARLRLRDKLYDGFLDLEKNQVVLNLTREELLFLIRVSRENSNYVLLTERDARLALATKLQNVAENVFNISSPE